MLHGRCEAQLYELHMGFGIHQNIYMHACELLHDDRSHNYTLTYVIHIRIIYLRM